MKLTNYLLEKLNKTTISLEDVVMIISGKLDLDKFKLSGNSNYKDIFSFLTSEHCFFARSEDVKDILGDDFDKLLDELKSKVDKKEIDKSLEKDKLLSIKEDENLEDPENKQQDSKSNDNKYAVLICDKLFGIKFNELYFYKWLYKEDDVYMIGTDINNEEYIKIIESIV